MSTHDFDSGRRFWLVAAVLASLTGALLAPGCDARNLSGEQIVESPSLQPIRIDGGFQRGA